MNHLSFFIKKRYKTLMASCFMALFMTCLSYFVTNLNYTISGEKEVIHYTRVVRDILSGKLDGNVPDSIALVNVSYDRMLVPVEDEYGFSKGQIDITDRQKLADFMLWLHDSVQYKSILCDVFFDPRYKTDYDDMLFATMADMPRLVVPSHSDSEDLPSELRPISGRADYNTSILDSDLSKVPLFDESGTPSMCALLYEKLGYPRLEAKYGIYTSDGALIRKCVYPHMYVRVNTELNDQGEKNYMNLGADVVEYIPDGLLDKGLFEGKHIVIGAFEDLDQHSTNAGELSGALVNINIVLGLMHGTHYISVWFAILLFALYWLLSYYIIQDALTHKGQKYLVVLWTLYSSVLVVICAVTYFFFNVAYDIFISSTVFSFVHWILMKLFGRKKS